MLSMETSGPRQDPRDSHVNCHVCTYYAGRLKDDSGASDGERDGVLREQHRHERNFHPERNHSGLRVPR